MLRAMATHELTRATVRPPTPGGHLHLDASMGCAGDMFTAALLDLGLPLVTVRTALIDVGVRDIGPLVRPRVTAHARGLHVSFVDASGRPIDEEPLVAREAKRPATREKTSTRGRAPRREGRRKKGATIALAREVDDDGRPRGDDVGVSSSSPGHGSPRRALLDWASGRPVRGQEVLALVESGRLSPSTLARAVIALRRLFDARGRALGLPMLDVTLDGRSALDAVCDIVAVSSLVDALAPSAITATAVAVSDAPVSDGGALAHGPSTWVLAALDGVRTVARPFSHECTTPTGAALVFALAGAHERRPPLAFHRVGVGFGTREVPGVVNAARALYAERRGAVVDGAAVLVECVVRPDADRRAIARALTREGARDVVFARVEDAEGAPLFVVRARVDDDGDAPLRALALLAAHGDPTVLRAEARATSRRTITVPLGRGARAIAVRVHVRGDDADPEVDTDDLRRASRALGVDEDAVSRRARRAYARLVLDRDVDEPRLAVRKSDAGGIADDGEE